VEKSIPIDETTKVVEILRPLSSEDRNRVIRAAMVLLGDTGSIGSETSEADDSEAADASTLGALPLRARAWMKQNGVSAAELQQVFHITDGAVEVIASHMPGKNKKEQTYSAYILTGLGQLLLTGNPSFQDKPARGLCETSGCYDSANHSTHLNNRGNEFTGTKDKGWVLTAPGLKRAAAIIKELAQAGA
jgi:hypothetical protein